MDVSKRFKLRGGKIPIHRIPVASPAPEKARGSTLIGRWAMFNNSARYAEQRGRNGNQYLILDHYANMLTVCGGYGHDLYHDVPVSCVTVSDSAHYVHDLRIGTRLRVAEDRQESTWILGGLHNIGGGIHGGSIYAFRLHDWRHRIFHISAVEPEEIPDTPAPFVRGDRVDFSALGNDRQGTVTAVQWEPLTDGNDLGGWFVWVRNHLQPTPAVYSASALRFVSGVRGDEWVAPIIDDAAEPEPEDQEVRVDVSEGAGLAISPAVADWAVRNLLDRPTILRNHAPPEELQEHFVGDTVYAIMAGAWTAGTIRRATYERDGWNYLIDLPGGLSCVRTEDGIRTPGPFPDATPRPRFAIGEEVEYRSASGRTSLGRVRTRDVRPGEEDVYTVALYSGSLVMGFESQLSSVESEAGEQHGQAEEAPPPLQQGTVVQSCISRTREDGVEVREVVASVNPRDVWDETILVGDFVVTHNDDLSWYGQVARVTAITDERATVQAWAVHEAVPLSFLVRVPPTFAVGDWVRVPQLADDACVVQVEFDRTMQVATEAGEYLWVRWSDASRCAGS